MSWKRPARQPGDPPWKYGNDIPAAYTRALDARVHAEMAQTDARLQVKRAEADHARELDQELEKSLAHGRKARTREDADEG